MCGSFVYLFRVLYRRQAMLPCPVLFLQTFFSNVMQDPPLRQAFIVLNITRY